MTKKWYNYFVSVDEANSAGPSSSSVSGPGASSKSRAQSVAGIASSVAAEEMFSRAVSDPTSFVGIYIVAEIPAVLHGYSRLKVDQMIERKHIRNLPSHV